MNIKATIGDLKGRRLTTVTGLKHGSKEAIFNCDDGSAFRMYHRQDCCESVLVEDVIGDVKDLFDTVVLDAREEVSVGDFDRDHCKSATWTFYIIQTDKGAVSIRWLGTSNGYYNESVDFERWHEVSGENNE